MVLSSTKTGTLLHQSSSQTVQVIQKVKYKIFTKDIMVRFVNIKIGRVSFTPTINFHGKSVTSYTFELELYNLKQP